MTALNIISVYNLANLADRAEGGSWYPSARSFAQLLASRYGLSLTQAVGVIAALSPRNKWNRNMADAESLAKVWQADPQAAAGVKVCTFAGNKAKALQILADPAISTDAMLAILSGPKLKEFASCILGDHQEVCIDGHAYSVWLGDRVTLANVPSITPKLRRQIKADYVAAAEILGEEPATVQAVTWCAWRRLHGVA